VNNENEKTENQTTDAYKVYVVDNFLRGDYADIIEKACLSEVPWYFLEDITHGDRTTNEMQKVPAFTHVFADSHTGASGFFELVRGIPYGAQHIPKASIKRVVGFLQMPNKGVDNSYNNIHTDMEAEHIVLLYYVNDSDGETFFFDADDNVTQVVSPKKNRAVIFNGNTRHASSRPKFHPRCVVNFNLITEY